MKHFTGGIMKRIILLIVGLCFFSLPAEAQQYLWNYRTAATDCTALTGGKATHLCYEQSTQKIYKCVPSAGDCDTPSEWKLVAGSATPGGSGTEIQYRSGAASFGAVAGSSYAAGTVNFGSNGLVTSGSGTFGNLTVNGNISASGKSLVVGSITAAGTNTMNITGNAATATNLASKPSGCSAGQYASDIAASGNLTCGTPAGGGGISGTIIASSPGNVALYSSTDTIVFGTNTINISGSNVNVNGNIVATGKLGTFGSLVSPGTNTMNITGNSGTATALATDPTACSGGQYVSDIAANGTLTCGTPAGGSSLWSSGTGGIYYSSGMVGIGTSTPISALQVTGEIDAPSMVLSDTGTFYNGIVVNNNTDQNVTLIRVDRASTDKTLKWDESQDVFSLDADLAVPGLILTGAGSRWTFDNGYYIEGASGQPLNIVGNVDFVGTLQVNGSPVSAGSINIGSGSAGQIPVYTLGTGTYVAGTNTVRLTNLGKTFDIGQGTFTVNTNNGAVTGTGTIQMEAYYGDGSHLSGIVTSGGGTGTVNWGSTGSVGFFASSGVTMSGTNLVTVGTNSVMFGSSPLTTFNASTGSWGIGTPAAGAILSVGGTIHATALNLSGGANPTIAAGPGAGTSPTLTISGTDDNGRIHLLTGSSPTANSAIATVTFGSLFPNDYSLTLTPENSFAASLGSEQPYVLSSSSTFTINSGTVSLTGARQYNWQYVGFGR